MLFTCWRRERRPRCQRKGTSARPREEAAHTAPHSGSHAVRLFNTVDPSSQGEPWVCVERGEVWTAGPVSLAARGLAVGEAGVDAVQPLAGCDTSLPRIHFPHQESHSPGWKPEVRFPASFAAGPSHVTPAHPSEASREPLLRKREGGAGGTGEGGGAGGSQASVGSAGEKRSSSRGQRPRRGLAEWPWCGAGVCSPRGA